MSVGTGSNQPPKPRRTKKVAGGAAPIKSRATTAALSPKQQRFVDEYLVDLNATQAAIRAGYSTATAAIIGFENLIKPNIQQAIAQARKEQQERTQISADMVVQEAWSIVTADPRELVDVKVGCCRCCHGEGHKPQRTLSEFNADREVWLNKGKDITEFDEAGGIGFNPLQLPNPECPACGGDGHARVVLKDTRHLSSKAVALYAGAKQTKFGVEIQMHDKASAMEKLFKHLGLYEKDNEQKTDPLTTLLHTLSKGNGNGFKPVQHDPEAALGAIGASGITPDTIIQRGDDDDD